MYLDAGLEPTQVPARPPPQKKHLDLPKNPSRVLNDGLYFVFLFLNDIFTLVNGSVLGYKSPISVLLKTSFPIVPKLLRELFSTLFVSVAKCPSAEVKINS
jgi:hypothetical protein